MQTHFTATEAAELVERHNYWRKIVSPYASKMNKIVWDPYLAWKAEKYITKVCAMSHNTNKTYPVVCGRQH